MPLTPCPFYALPFAGLLHFHVASDAAQMTEILAAVLGPNLDDRVARVPLVAVRAPHLLFRPPLLLVIFERLPDHI